jgi:maltokinase
MSDSLPLPRGFEITLERQDDRWDVTPRHLDGRPCRPGDGASEALVALLLDGGELSERWQALRLVTVPRVSGERAVDVDQTNTSVIVGEALVVKWLRSVSDRPHPAMAALAQLQAVGFDRTPTTYAVLTWSSPSGHTLPVAYVTDYLTAAHDG